MQKINGLRKLILLLVFLGVIPGVLLAQDSDLRPVTSKYAIKNATIVQAPGRIIQKGTVVFENGVIKSVGANVSIPKDALVIDADSMYVYAGFISGMSNIGVPKPKEDRERPDRKLRANPPYDIAGITPGANVTSMLVVDDKSIEEYRQLGFTAAHTVPHNGMMAGSSALILLGGKTSSNMVIQDEYTLFSQLSGANGVYPNTVIGVMAKYRDMYRKAQQAMDYEAKYKANSSGMARPITDLTLEALYPVVKKQMPVSFEANDVLDVMRVLTLKNELGFNLMLGEVKQGWDAIDKIKAANASLFLSLDLPELKEEKKEEAKKDEKAEEKDGEAKAEEVKKEEKPKVKTAADLEKEALEKRQKEMIVKYYAQASMFNSKGVKFGFSTLDSKSKDFKATLNNIIKNGLPEDQALAALTTSPAEIFGLSSKMGTIDNGKMANLIVTDKPYFDEKSNVRFVFVDGVLFEYEVKEKKKKNGGEPVKPNGAWNYTSSTPQGEGSGVITITGSEGNYAGTMTLSFNDSTNDIDNLDIDGNTISFSVSIDAGGQQMTMDVTMTIDGDTFEGTMTVGQFGSFPLSGSKSPENN
jgi:imidazolonepropionase-like amidohydrolase